MSTNGIIKDMIIPFTGITEDTMDIQDKKIKNRNNLIKKIKINKCNKILQLTNSIFTGVLFLLAFRFILQMTGLSNNLLTNILYKLSYLFVGPIFLIKNSFPKYGGSHIEIESIISIAVYSILSIIISSGINIFKNIYIENNK